MSAAPIYTAVILMRGAIIAAIPTAHWQRNESSTPVRPFIVFDSQDLGGKLWESIGRQGWRGLVTIRAVADYQDEADTAMTPIFTALEGPLFAPTGYSIRAVYERPITIPPTSDARYAAAQWEFFIERT